MIQYCGTPAFDGEVPLITSGPENKQAIATLVAVDFFNADSRIWSDTKKNLPNPPAARPLSNPRPRETFS